MPIATPHPARAWRRTDLALAALLFLASLSLYTATLAPTIVSTSFDSPELVTKAGLLELAHIPGSPVYVWTGHLFARLPFGEVAARVNWMSAFWGALAVAVLYVVAARHLTAGRLCAVGGALLFALSLTFWSQAVMAELYTPGMALLGLSVLALLEWAVERSNHNDNPRARRWLVASAGLFGLSLGVHPSNLLYLPAFTAFALMGLADLRACRPALSDRPRPQAAPVPLPSSSPPPPLRRFDVWGGVLAALVGLVAVAVPYAWVYISLPHVPPGDDFPKAAPGWPLFYESTINAFHQYRFAFPIERIPERIGLFLHLLARNLGPVGVPLMLVGACRLAVMRLRVFALMALMVLANVVFYINYKVPDNDVFYIPAYWVMGGLMAVGLQAVAVGTHAGWHWLQRHRHQLGRHTGPPPEPAMSGSGDRWSLAGAWPVPVGAGMVLATLLALAGAGWQWQSNYWFNDQSGNVAFRDFWGNAFDLLPQGAYIYHRGASPGYDLLYYTRLCGVRPDLHVLAGPGSPASPPPVWPSGPVFSGVTRYDCCLPDFIKQDGTVPKWYEPVLTGMFRWQHGMQYGWLNLFRVRAPDDLPPDWAVPIDDPASRPSKKLNNIPYTSELVLAGVDAEPQAYAGRPWRMVRYWYSQGQSTWMPPMVTILGDYIAVESHVPLFNQLADYVKARGISDMGLYVIKDEVNLVIPSDLPPGKYKISVARATPRLVNDIMLDPAQPSELVFNEHVVTEVQVLAGQGPPDPLARAANPICTR